MALPNQLPQAFAGVWHSGGWIGMEGVAVAPTVSALLTLILSPILFLKVYAPLTLLFLGFSAWLYFRQLEFSPWVCVLGGLAAGLNMHFFSVACWGLGAWNIATGMVFLAMAALSTKAIPQFWARGVLAGLALGMNLMEGFDVGVLQCVFFGVFIVWQILSANRPDAKAFVRAFAMEALVIFFSAFIAVHSIASLVNTQVTGVSGTAQDAETKEQRWDFATRWSLPKIESLRIIMPGLFGYRMSSRINVADRSSAYWGTVGRDPRMTYLIGDDPKLRNDAMDSLAILPAQREILSGNDPLAKNDTFRALLTKLESAARYSGSGEYAGVLVSLFAIFALINSFRGANSPFSPQHRRLIWFWGAAALFCLAASWGRHGFIYRFLYQLPYVSTVRNPIKLLHLFHVAWIVLAAYGMDALWRRYLQNPAASIDWPKLAAFEKKWIIGTVTTVVAAIGGAIIYNAWKPHLIGYLVSQGFDSAKAISMADFSNAEARWFVFWLIASTVTIALAIEKKWTGPRARTVLIAAGLILVIDLVRSDLPWIHYFNYDREYAFDESLKFLQDKPYEHRVIGRLVPKALGSGLVLPIGQLYDYWQQNDFPFHGIQTTDFAQWPRTPELDAAYLKNFYLHGESLTDADLWPAERLWELTSTRYIFYTAKLASIIQDRADAQHNIRVNTFLTVRAKPGVTFLEDAGDLTAVPDPHGNCALLEFTNALPRAGLYANWESPTNNDAILKRLLDHEFDPHHSVLLAPETPVTQPSGDAKTDPGTVAITLFKSKYVKLKADVKTPAILMLNDRVAPDWKALVDGKPVPILRCNYIMRGVFLAPGSHVVEFKFRPKLTTAWISLCAWMTGIGTAGFLVWSRKTNRETLPTFETTPVPPSASTPPPKPALVTAEAPSHPPRAGKQKKRR